ncbi:glycosyltransferase [Okeania sp. SIO2B3]|uniref:glycosyltransferase n=1 Tax=Okeania sp. SIO2B3 TaxID=2607784 RepID=UPI0013BF2372|nr:glycosyltransferase [Okeania sp. SIO2B3]NET45301.1 glycosyltransferase family 1 protein [Okeania sp. SIO2B3]
MTDLPPIYFYLPQKDWLDDMPDKPDVYWEEFGRGIYCWTLQTYLYLKADGFPCTLVGTMPDEGIVIAHRDSFPYKLRPTPKVLMVCIKPDRNPHPYAQLQVVQNPQDAKNFRNSYYIPLWRQPGLIPRNSERGDRFENIGYFGITSNLAPELKAASWSKQLEELRLNWQIIPRNRWYDYSNIDAVVAVRNFQQQDYTQKPATKLYNAWQAGVPAILGKESAFQSERKNEFDYFEVSSVEDAIDILKRLRDNPQLCEKVRENGKVRGQEIEPQNVVKQWRNFLTDVAVPEYQRWFIASRWSQQVYLQRCYLLIKFDALKQKLSLT